MNIELKTEYWDDLDARKAFKTFILDIHGLDFTEWEARGYWDKAYTPFSYFKDEQIIASVCIYLLDATVEGRSTKLVQISGVGTSQDWRRQGLSRKLTNLGLDSFRGQHKGVFLFADEEAIPYYLRCGFSSLDESQEFCQINAVSAKSGLVRLNPEDQLDLDRIYSYAKSTAPVSDKFSIFSPKLLMFHALCTLRNKIYEIPELDCLVFFDRDGDVVNIYDILARSIPTFEEIYPYISSETDKQINFHFHTDKLGIRGIQTRALLGNNAFVKGSFPLSTPVFPFTSRA